MLKLFLTSIILFLSVSYFAQTGKTIFLDSITKLPISFVKVSIPNKDVFVLSNSKGEIQLDTLWNQTDKLLVFCYGYKPQYITSQTEKSVFLSPLYKQLKPITITAKKHRYGRTKLGETDHPSPREVKSDRGVNVLTGENGELMSVWIPNEKSLKGYLEKVNVFILAMGHPTANFRLHFYECSKLKLKPGKEITSQNIIAKGTTGNEWVSVDVSELRIPLFENGIFVGIEWFENEINTSFTDTLTYKINYVDRGQVLENRVFKGNGCVIGLEYDTYLKNKHKNWRYRNQKWMDIYLNLESSFYKIDSTFKVPHKLIPDRLQISVPCINVDVKYTKQKNTSEFDDAKKRKLNRIEKVKEDNFMYPQSTVEELFSSLIKAIEKNDLIYVLKYLCVYRGDQFDNLVKDVKEWEGKLSPNNQEKCLKFLNTCKNGLKDEFITHIEGNEYSLEVDGELMYLLHEKGKWKINPFSSRIERGSVFEY